MEGVFKVVVSNVTREGTFIGEVFMRTSYAKVCGALQDGLQCVCEHLHSPSYSAQELHVPIHYKVVLGSLEINPAKIFFNAFPVSTNFPLHHRLSRTHSHQFTLSCLPSPSSPPSSPPLPPLPSPPPPVPSLSTSTSYPTSPSRPLATSSSQWPSLW